MKNRAPRSAFDHIEQIASDRDSPIGHRLQSIRDIKMAVEKAERRLLVQLGGDIAKHMFAEGYTPQNKPLLWHFDQRRALESRITPNGDTMAGAE